MHSLKKLVTWALCSGVAFTSICAFGGSSGPRTAPRFVAKTLSGETFTNESVKGKVVLVQFWTTWCPLCRGEQSLVDRIESEYRDQDLIVLAVDVGESKKKVAKYIAANPRSCRIVLTNDTNLPAIYPATAYPMYVVIDRDGNIAGTQRGAGGERALRSLLRRAGLESDQIPQEHP